MGETFNGTCMMCLKDKEVRNIPLYIIGSEGLDICHDCEMDVVRYIRKRRTSSARVRKAEFLKKRRRNNAKNLGDCEVSRSNTP